MTHTAGPFEIAIPPSAVPGPSPQAVPIICRDDRVWQGVSDGASRQNPAGLLWRQRPGVGDAELNPAF